MPGAAGAVISTSAGRTAGSAATGSPFKAITAAMLLLIQRDKIGLLKSDHLGKPTVADEGHMEWMGGIAFIGFLTVEPHGDAEGMVTFRAHLLADGKLPDGGDRGQFASRREE